MNYSKNRKMSADELAKFGAELEAIKHEQLSEVGEVDARYIRRIVVAVRYTEVVGRGLLFLSFFPPFWLLGVLVLAVSKILENMELGHNVIHGQYDFMNEPSLKGSTYEWDIAGTSDNWRESHNYKHHTYTNIKGMDDDVGYGMLRLFPEQRWSPMALFQTVYATVLALLFQWGIAIQELQLGKIVKGSKTWGEMREELKPVIRKINRQLLKDYVIFPLLAGPIFLSVLAGNFTANILRNLWTFMIIFCGHFTTDAEVFHKSILNNELPGHWYLRQLRGSSNLKGGKLFHILSGNLSHQIEHHLFPTVPARRYAAMSVKVQEVCERYGQNYNNDYLYKQFGQVVWRIIRHSFPSSPKQVVP